MFAIIKIITLYLTIIGMHFFNMIWYASWKSSMKSKTEYRGKQDYGWSEQLVKHTNTKTHFVPRCKFAR